MGMGISVQDGQQQDSRPLPEIIASLHRSGVSGRLEVTTSSGHRELIFESGYLLAARSSVEDEMLGSWLVANGVITEDVMALSLLNQVGSSTPPLGEALISGGHLTREVLATCLEKLAIDIIERATAERRISIRFDNDLKQTQPSTLARSATRRMILASARIMGDQKAQRRFLGSLKNPARLYASLQTINHDIEQTPNEEILLQSLAKTYYASLGSIRATLDIGQRDFLSAAYSLVVSGIIVQDQPSAPVSAARKSGDGSSLLNVVDAERLIEINLKRAEKLFELGNSLGAIGLLEELYEQEEQPCYLLKIAQVIDQDGGQPQKVLNTLRQVLEADPKMVEGWLELARFWRRNSNQERERRALEHALSLVPDNQEAASRYRQLKASAKTSFADSL
jgi:tetratricopeptide (TPR) repeat protein